MASSSELRWSLVMSEEGQGTFAVQVQSPLQCWKQRQKGFSQASDGPTLVGNEIATASKQKLQLGDLLFTWFEHAEVWPHPRLVGYDVGITGIGFGLAAVGVASPVYAEAWDVENTLWFRSHSSASKSAVPPPG